MANNGRNSPGPKGSEPHELVRLGLRYLTAGDGTAEPARGIALIEQAAQAGDALGAYLAATIASSSFWRPRNWDQAFDHLTRAAERGHQPALSSLRILAGGPSGNEIDGEHGHERREQHGLHVNRSPVPAGPAVRPSLLLLVPCYRG